MVIRHNLMALNTGRIMSINSKNQKKNTEKLASGYRINRAADDAAGLSISEKMRRQIRGLDQGAENISDGISLIQVADGALNEVHDILQRINELAVQAANGTNSESDRQATQQEVSALLTEIDRIGETTSFNEKKIFAGRRVDESGRSGTASSNHTKVHVTGKPADKTITDYAISADAVNGLAVNGMNFSWADIKTAGGDSLADGITEDDYSFTYNGLKLTLNVKGTDTLESIASAVDGLTFQTNHVSGKVSSVGLDYNSNMAMYYIDYDQIYVGLNHSGECEITADDAGITVTNKSTGEWTYVDFYNGVGSGYTKTYEELMQEGTLSSLTFELPDSQYTITLGLDSGWNKQDVIDALNGCTYETAFSGNVEDYMTTVIPGFGRYDPVSFTGSWCNFSKDFYVANGCNLEKLNIENVFEGRFIQTGTNNYDVKLTKDGHSTIFSLGTAGQVALANIATNDRWAAGTDLLLDFADADGNTIKLKFTTTVNKDYNYVQGLLGGNYFTNYGNSLYTHSNFKSAADQEYDLTLDKNNNTSSGRGRTSYVWDNIRIQSGADSDDFLMLSIGSMDADQIGLKGLSVASESAATDAIDAVSYAIACISKQRSMLGAQQNRLEHAFRINRNTSENTQYAESVIRDTDMAEMMVAYSNDQVLQNVAQSMLAQANQTNDYVLKLLQ